MRSSFLLPVLSACSLSLFGQSSVSSRILAQRTVPMDAHQSRVEVVRDALDDNGEPTQVTTSYIKLATGLNRLDATQKQPQWVPAVAEFERTDEGYFVARRTRTRLILPPDLSIEPVDMLGPDGVRLISAPIGVAVVDLSTGEVALLGDLKSCRAEQVAPDTVVFKDCLAGLRGDLLFRISLSGMEQCLVLREWVPSLAELGMNPDHVRIQFYTEFFDAPEPTGEIVVLKRADESTRAQRVWEPDLTDRALAFGESTRMIPGRAFTAGSQNLSAPVGKSYQAVGQRHVVAESCDYVDVAQWLEQLPVPKEHVRYKGARLEPGTLVPTNLPEREVTKPRWASLLFENRLRENAWASVDPGTLEAMDTRAYLAASGPGMVLDYTISGSQPNFCFRGGTTYEVVGTVYLAQSSTIEGGVVVKLPPATSDPKLKFDCPIICNTTRSRPAVFTATDDHTVGEVLGSGTLSGYYGTPALEIWHSGTHLHDLRISHAKTGIYFYDYSAGANSLRNCQFVNCEKAIWANGYGTTFQNLTVQNVLIHNVSRAFYGYSFNAQVEHLTVNGCTQLTEDYNGGQYGTTSSLSLLNSLLVAVGADGNANVDRSYTQDVSSSSGVFHDENESAGHHYLADGSPYRNAGTEQIDPDLLADIHTLTTSPPVVYEDLDISTPEEWSDQVDRDWGAPDLGYHYPPIDYAVSDVTVVGEDGRLSVTPGVVIAVFGNHGIIAEDYAQVSLVGSALDRITVAHYTAIQEQSELWGSSQYSPTMIYGPPHNVISGHDSPDVELRFVDTSVMGGRGNGVFFLNNWAAVKTLVVRDCRFFGGYTWFGSHASQSAVVEVCNNLFRRSENKFYGWMHFTAYNNLFFGGNSNQFSCYITQPNTWTVKDNVFQDTCIGGSASYIARGCNAYLGTVSPVPPGWGAAGDVTLSSFAYAAGPLGEFYQADTGLKNAGSRTAAEAGLFHHTAEATEIKEGADPDPTVDIGFHYLGIDLGGQNLALYGTATQVATYETATADLAIDGNRDGVFSHGSVSHTPGWSQPWWQVDLGDVGPIAGVRVWNRTDACCMARLSDFYVFVSHDPFQYDAVSETLNQSGVEAFYFPGEAGTMASIMTYTAGRYVRVQLTGATCLNMAEVEVWSDALFSGRDEDDDGVPDYLADMDGDEMPDSWEIEHFGNILSQTGSGDADGDGLSNLEELASNTDPMDVDSDYDGRSDGEEAGDGTDPLNAAGVVDVRLGYWRFNTGNWAGDDGQLPAAALNLQAIPSWSGNAVDIDDAGGANLEYQEIEGDGSANVNFARGTIRFWFKPNWASGTGPGASGRFIELGSSGSDGWWALSVIAAGTQIEFASRQGGMTTTHMTEAISGWTSDAWHQIAVTYDSTGTVLYVDGVAIDYGAGVAAWPSAATRTSNSFTIGSNGSGDEQVKGQMEELETFNHPLDPGTISTQYQRIVNVQTPDPEMLVMFRDTHVNTSIAPVIVSGDPTAEMAVIVETSPEAVPDFQGATWEPFAQTFNVDLGTGDGPRYVWVAFRGMPDGQGNPGPQIVRLATVILDTVPPVLTITEPLGATTSLPFIQVRGTADEGLSSVTFDLLNAAGTFLGEPAFVLPAVYDEEALAQQPPPGTAPSMLVPLNWPFQLFDVELAEGSNAITIIAADVAGNTTTFNVNCTLDFTTDQTPPTITVHWPPPDTQVAGDVFDLRGVLDDPCASVVVTGLTTEPVEGIVERNGAFWVEALPLAPGQNQLTAEATDAAGNVSTESLTISRNSATLTIDPLVLTDSFVGVTGTITDNQHAVWVNGIKVDPGDPAHFYDNGTGSYTWDAENVPLGDGGTAVVQARAIPMTSNGGDGTGQEAFAGGTLGNPTDPDATELEGQWDRRDRVYLRRYFELMRYVPASCQGEYTQEAWMNVHRNSSTGYRSFALTDHPDYTDQENIQTWPAFTDQGVGLGCVPPASNGTPGPGQVPVSQAAWYELPFERCAVIDTQSPLCGGTDSYIRVAHTEVRLHTGGKAVVGSRERNLFHVTASAWAVDDARRQPPYPVGTSQFNTMTTPIPANDVSVLGQHSDSAGNVYVALPDGWDFNITPTAAASFYVFTVDAQKHDLVLTADGHDLQEDTPEFCVGEKVDFVAAFDPQLPGDALAGDERQILQWVLPEKYVNKPWRALRDFGKEYPNYQPVGSANYRVNHALLQDWGTSCWYVNADQTRSLPVSFGASLVFKNGESAVICRRRSIRLHRPLIRTAQPWFFPLGARLLPNPFSFLGIQLPLGYAEVRLDDDAFTPHVDVISSYAGTANWVQLISSDTWSDCPHFGYFRSTGGEYYCDNSDPYENTTIIPAAIPQHVPHSDGPSWIGLTWLSVDEDFKAYLRFRPDRGEPDENIYVTLARADWAWQAYSEKNNGQWIDPPIAHFLPPPSLHDDDTFPRYYYTLLNGFPYRYP